MRVHIRSRRRRSRKRHPARNSIWRPPRRLGMPPMRRRQGPIQPRRGLTLPYPNDNQRRAPRIIWRARLWLYHEYPDIFSRVSVNTSWLKMSRLFVGSSAIIISGELSATIRQHRENRIFSLLLSAEHGFYHEDLGTVTGWDGCRIHVQAMNVCWTAESVLQQSGYCR